MDAHLKALENSKFACFWLDHEARPEPLRALSGDQRCELLTVGGGFTGMWAALQAKERNPELGADRNDGKRGLWLKLLDRLKPGFAC